MKNYEDSDYALNKNADGIVYFSATGSAEVVSLDKFLDENPKATAKDFANWKALSDADYLERDRVDYKQTYKDKSLDWAEQAGECYVKSPEETISDSMQELEKRDLRAKHVALAKLAMDKLTKIQRRRYLMHVVNGLSTWQIADIEGLNQKTVYESLLAAENKIKKVLAES